MRRGLLSRSVLGLALLATVFILAGCARFPAGSSLTSFRAMTFQITFDGPINDNYYYFVALDTQGGAAGPQPIFPNPDIPSGNDWVTGAATHYVMYYQRQYLVFRIDTLHPLQATPIGSPVRFTLPDPGGNTLNFTLDLDSINATGPSVDVNVITLNHLSPDGRLLDALGPLGTDFVNIDITSTRTFLNSSTLRPEGTGDVLNQNGIVQPSSDLTKPLDIADWTISVNI